MLPEVATPIDWDAAAQALGYADAREMWNVLYVEQRKSISGLAEQFSCAQRTVRNALTASAIPFRNDVGGWRRERLRFSPEETAQIREEGVRAAAARLGISVAAIYGRLWRAEKEASR